MFPSEISSGLGPLLPSGAGSFPGETSFSPGCRLDRQRAHGPWLGSPRLPWGHSPLHWRGEQQPSPGLTSPLQSSQPETPALLPRHQFICAFNHPHGIGFFPVSGVLLPCPVGTAGGGQHRVPTPRKVGFFPLSFAGRNSRFLLRVRGSPYRGANPKPQPCLFHRSRHDAGTARAATLGDDW